MQTKKKHSALKVIIIFAVYVVISLILQMPPFVIIGNKIYCTYRTELRLNCDDSKFTNNNIHSIKYMRFLKKLNIDAGVGSDLTDGSFLNDLPNLEQLIYMGHTDHHIEDWSPLNNCKKLEVFWGGMLEMDNLSCFKGLSNIKELSLEFIGGTDFFKVSDLSELEGLTNIENFTVRGYYLSDISALDNLTTLKSLSIIDSKVSDISAVEYLSELEYLSIESSVPISDYSVVFKLPKLKKLSVAKGALTEKEISALKEKGITVFEDQ